MNCAAAGESDGAGGRRSPPRIAPPPAQGRSAAAIANTLQPAGRPLVEIDLAEHDGAAHVEPQLAALEAHLTPAAAVKRGLQRLDRAASISSSRSSAHLRRSVARRNPFGARSANPARLADRARASGPDGAPAPARTAGRPPPADRSRRCVHLSCIRRARVAMSARASAEVFGIGKGAMNCLLADQSSC